MISTGAQSAARRFLGTPAAFGALSGMSRSETLPFRAARRLLSLVLLPLLALASCAPVAPGRGDILVIGDSVMAWNGASGQAIGDAIAAATGRSVTDRAVPLARIAPDSAILGATGLSIPNQYAGGTWNWIVANGGANDLSARCGCGACGPVVDNLIAPDGRTGEIPELIARLRGSGARVLWMGYYAGSGQGGFTGCRDDLVEIERRIAVLAARTEGVIFVDSETVFDNGDPANFAPDDTHPSPRGSAVIGRYLAGIIAR
jgi:hypothetical protein